MDNITKTQKIQEYLQNSTHYAKNSQDLFKQRELAKAGELLWGANAEAAKALHLMVKGKPLYGHKRVVGYLKQLSFERSRKTKMGEAARQLHINFYEASLLQEEKSIFFEQYRDAELLYGLLMDKVKEKSGEKNLV
jgi:hypothetical protein